MKQPTMWVATEDLPRSAAHPFHARLNQILDQDDFDAFVEGLCERFYADDGRPGLPPGRYFRLLLIGYFEGLDAERAIAWRAADSFALREFLGLVLPDAPPDHSTISRTRRLIDLETHEVVFTSMLQRLADAGLVKGKTVGIDTTTLEANAALRSIVRRDTGESYQDFLTNLAQASGIETPTPLLIHTGGFNLGLLMRQLIGVGTSLGLQGRLIATMAVLLVLIGALWARLAGHGRSVRRQSSIEGDDIAISTVVHTAVREMAFTTGC